MAFIKWTSIFVEHSLQTFVPQLATCESGQNRESLKISCDIWHDMSEAIIFTSTAISGGILAFPFEENSRNCLHEFKYLKPWRVEDPLLWQKQFLDFNSRSKLEKLSRSGLWWNWFFSILPLHIWRQQAVPLLMALMIDVMSAHEVFELFFKSENCRRESLYETKQLLRILIREQFSVYVQGVSCQTGLLRGKEIIQR